MSCLGDGVGGGVHFWWAHYRIKFTQLLSPSHSTRKPDAMKWRWMRCEISFFTENNEADLPSSLSTTVGWMPPEPETLTKSMEPPATDRKGRTPSKTSSTASSVMSGACVETMFYGAFVLNRCGDLHAIDATPARWRGAAGSSPQSAPTH